LHPEGLTERNPTNPQLAASEVRFGLRATSSGPAHVTDPGRVASARTGTRAVRDAG